MKSILFVSLMPGSPWGGSEELWYRTALLALHKGHTIGCVVYYWPGKEEKMKALRDGGAEIFYLPNKGRTKKNLLQRIENKISKQRSRAFIRAVPVEAYDAVVVNQGAFEIITPAWKGFAERLSDYVVLYHNYKEGEVFRGAKAAAIRRLAAGAKKNLLASWRITEVLKQYSGIELPHADTLFNPITFTPPASITAYPEVSGNYRLVMLAALETDRKAQDQLVMALSQPAWKQRSWTLHLYGEGKHRVQLQSLIKKNGMDQRIFLEGHASDVKKVLQEAHLLLQLTHIDAMPLSVVEAMAMARPVAVSKIGDMPHWVEEGRNGWISENASAMEIGKTLERAWQQRTQWPQMGARAYEIFRKKYPASPEERLLNQVLE